MVRPLYSVEVTETETAKFETEISEDDVHGNWKLKGEALQQSAVSGSQTVSFPHQFHSTLFSRCRNSEIYAPRLQDSHFVCHLFAGC